MKLIRCITATVAIIVISNLWGPRLGQAQVRPDTTRLLEEAGLDPAEHTKSASKASLGKVSDEAPASASAYDLPFAGKDNKLELTIRNSTHQSQHGVTVQVVRSPVWLAFDRDQLRLSELESQAATKVRFGFDVSDQAPIGETGTVTLQAVSAAGAMWEKTLAFRIAAPQKFELLPNYPNPFSPATMIPYRLPAPMRVTVTVYNILGRRVVTLADELQQAGQHEVRWNADGVASGMYICRIVAEEQEGQRFVEQQKMMLVK